MLGRLALFFIILLLISCSSGRFIQVKNTEPDVIEPISEGLIEEFRNLALQPEHNIGNYCRHIKEGYRGYALHAFNLACATKELSLPKGNGKEQIAKYNNALEPFLRLALYGQDTREYGLDVIHEKPLIDGLETERLVLASDVIPKDASMKSFRSERLGVSVVGYRQNNKTPSERWYPAEGLFRPFTVTAEVIVDDSKQLLTVVLTYHAMLKPRSISIGLNDFPLTYDLASPYLLLAESAKIDEFELKGLFFADDVENKLGIYAIEQLDNDKAPLLMIHGLNSSPLIWRRLSWALYSTPALAEKYQIWHAFYPSGPPPFFNAMRVRAKLDELVNEVFPPQDVPGMWVLGHSMGGIISRTMVVNSGSTLWDRTFTVGPGALGLPDADLEQLTAIFNLEARSYIDGVIFMDTPHQGSDEAESWIGKLTSAFIELPQSMRKLFGKIWKDQRERFLTNEMKPYMTATGPDSVRVLSPKHPLLNELSKLDPAVPVFSVIGNSTPETCNLNMGCVEFSDTVVPYQSAHLPFALKEQVVESKHNSYNSTEAIEFVLEILSTNFAPAPMSPASGTSDAQ